MGRRPLVGIGRTARCCAATVVLLVLALPGMATPAPATAPAAAAPPAAGVPVKPMPPYTPPILRHSKPAAPIDVNSASLAQLQALPGIGEARAKLIIAKRPYHSKAQLVTAGVLPAGVYQSIRHMIIAIQPGPTRPSKHP